MVIYCLFKIFTSLYGIEPSSGDAVPTFAVLSGLETFFEIVFTMLALILNFGGDIHYWISRKLRGMKSIAITDRNLNLVDLDYLAYAMTFNNPPYGTERVRKSIPKPPKDAKTIKRRAANKRAEKARRKNK